MVLKFSHWNVKGEGFYPAHKLIDKVYESVVDATDDIAERITALGGVAEGMPSQIRAACTLDPFSVGADDTVQVHLKAVAGLTGNLANEFRSGIAQAAEQGDLVTQDLWLKTTGELDHLLYFLEAHLRP